MKMCKRRPHDFKKACKREAAGSFSCNLSSEGLQGRTDAQGDERAEGIPDDDQVRDAGAPQVQDQDGREACSRLQPMPCQLPGVSTLVQDSSMAAALSCSSRAGTFTLLPSVNQALLAMHAASSHGGRCQRTEGTRATQDQPRKLLAIAQQQWASLACLPQAAPSLCAQTRATCRRQRVFADAQGGACALTGRQLAAQRAAHETAVGPRLVALGELGQHVQRERLAQAQHQAQQEAPHRPCAPSMHGYASVRELGCHAALGNPGPAGSGAC